MLLANMEYIGWVPRHAIAPYSNGLKCADTKRGI